MRVTLNGYVVADDDAWLYELFGYRAFGPADVRQALERCPEGETLVVEINSPGGSMFSGFEIYSVLRAAQTPTRAEIQSLAASAASTLMLGCDEVWASPVAQVMIHLPRTVTDGDQGAHRESIQLLDKAASSILAGYEAKCRGKRSREELEQMMASETWLTAQEALEAGLVDGILYQEDTAATLPAQVVNAAGGGIRALAAGGGLPSPAELRSRYEQLTGRPAQREALGQHTGWKPGDWLAQARLDLEKIRF